MAIFESVYHLVPDASDIDDADVLVIRQFMAQLGDEDVEASGIEEAIIAPEFQEDVLALHDVIPILHKHTEDFGFSMRQFHFFIIVLQNLLDGIQSVTTTDTKPSI